MYFLRCLQFEMSSFRLFRVAICGLDNMKNFSVIHRLQRLVAFAMMRRTSALQQQISKQDGATTKCLLSMRKGGTTPS